MTFLVNDFLTLFFIMVRVTAMLFSAPVFNSNSYTMSGRVFFCLTVSYILFFTVKPNQVAYDTGFGFLAMFAFKEAITGMIMGLSLNFVFYGITFAGTQMGMDIGLSMASAFDPTIDHENGLIGQILNMAAMLVLFTINGHHHILRGLSASFQVIPIGHYTFNEPVYLLLLKYSASVFVIAIKIAAPLMVAFFLMHVAAGIVSRIIPQMQVFFVIQPLQLALGLFLLVSSMPIIIYIIRNLLEGLEDNLYDLIKVMGY